MDTILITIVSLISAVVGLVIGNWLSLIPYILLLIILRPHKGQSAGLISLYVSRASMGFVAGILFAIMDHFGLNNYILTATFLFWAIFMSEPPLISNSAQILSHDILRGDMKKYTCHKAGLKAVRVLAYFVAKLGLYVSFLYFK